MKYQILDQLQQYKAQLLDSVELGSGMQLAMWQNNQDRVSVCSNHHTLSMYIQGGYESYQKTQQGWHNGGGPDRMCLMPQDLSRLGIYVIHSPLYIFTTLNNTYNVWQNKSGIANRAKLF
jgi:hypothetical protein